jgi:hypothetical protein
MAPVSVSLISLTPGTSLSAFINTFTEDSIKPILFARVVQWIITPTIAEHLLQHNWDFLIVYPTEHVIPESILKLVSAHFVIRFNQDDEMLAFTKENNDKLIHPETEEPTHNLDKPLVANSTQNVELTPALLAFAQSPHCPTGPVSMLNFMAFHPFPSSKETYSKYIDGFKSSVGKKRGGVLKIYGETQEMGIWQQVALAQYPTLAHFADMAADSEYQELNHKYRLPALRDTCILMTTEVKLDWGLAGSTRWDGRV